jgi:hypothetical protein
MTLAATDCEILNSGISLISSIAFCTETAGITCVNGRVTKMYEFSVFNSISVLEDVDGHLPLEKDKMYRIGYYIDLAKNELSARCPPQ